MSQYYSAKKTRGLFNPDSAEPFRLSRSKIDLFIECPRCFYIDRRLGVGRPPGFPFTLNSAVDLLLKKEFDIHRDGQTAHPLMEAYGLKARPFQHKEINNWRENFVGIHYHHADTNLLITGAIDDVWINDEGELHIVDYKSTSKDTEVNLDAEWQDGYKRQMEIYQWLFRQNGFKVSKTGFFVYANGMRDRKVFDGKLEFEVKLIPYEGSDEWVEKALKSIKACLADPRIPKCKSTCDFCAYTNALESVIPQKKSASIEIPKTSKKKKITEEVLEAQKLFEI